MYEDYMQDYYNYPLNEFQNTYDGMQDFYPYFYEQNRGMYDYNYFYPQMGYQGRGMTNSQIEELYPDVYKIIYPMIKRVCNKNSSRAINQDVIENMVEEVYTNVEETGQIELNRSENQELKDTNKETENRQSRKNNNLLDIIKILILRELIGRPGCNRPGCRPNMPPPRPPFYSR